MSRLPNKATPTEAPGVRKKDSKCRTWVGIKFIRLSGILYGRESRRIRDSILFTVTTLKPPVRDPLPRTVRILLHLLARWQQIIFSPSNFILKKARNQV